MKTTDTYTVRELTLERNLKEIIHLTMQLEHGKNKEDIIENLKLMFQFDNYECIGFYDEEKLVGLSSLWTLV